MVIGAQGPAHTDVQSPIVRRSANSKDLVIYTEGMFSGQIVDLRQRKPRGDCRERVTGPVETNAKNNQSNLRPSGKVMSMDFSD
jgi:hypothetical protein